MADKIKVSSDIKFVANFNDGDTRTITMPNPKSVEQLPALLGALQTYLLSVHGLVGDKNEGAFTHISDARVVQTTEMTLDIGL